MGKWNQQSDRRFSRRDAIGRMAATGLGMVSVLNGGIEPLTIMAQTPIAPASRKKGVVQTVQGPLDAAKLGFTLTHEHLCATSAGYWQAWPEFFGGRANFIARVVDKLKAAKEGGVNTFVDLTTIDLGRDIRLIQEVSQKSGMQIIACTGHWLDPSRSMNARTVEELTDYFTREIEHGIEGTGIKPGVIKLATDRDGVTPFLEKALRAGARASKATGVPIETHSFARGRIGEKQAELFEAEGLSPSAVCIGHSDDSDDMAYLLGLAKRGYTIGMDRLPYGIVQPAAQRQGGATAAAPAQGRGGEAAPTPPAPPVTWQKRCECIKGLVDAGFGNQIFLSHDWGLVLSLGATAGATMEARDRANPDGILFNTRKVLPYLKQIGVADSAIHAMTVDNQRRFFGGV